ncbi:MAG: bifunctional aspartate kinase/homoserine dehydrogenase I [Ignavibacteriales bacterium]
MRVLKFGGSSVGTPERIRNVVEIIIDSVKDNEQLAVVFSAFHGITDHLILTGKTASYGNDDYLELLEKFRNRHLKAVAELLPEGFRDSLSSECRSLFNELTDILQGIYLIRELSPKSLDSIMSFGERLSALIICEVLRHNGVDAEYLDARQLIKTDNSFGCGRVKTVQTHDNIKNYFSAHKKHQIVTGFIASTLKDETITLGRGGSDYTAAIFGAALEVSEVEIWTDVEGIMTADPRKVKDACSVGFLSYEEAREISHFGAKVIHPPTMQPAMDKQIPIRIKNTFNPDFDGTLVGAAAGPHKATIKGIASIENISAVRIHGRRMSEASGIAERIFRVLAKHNVPIILVTQASSENSICLAFSTDNARDARELISNELRFEIRDGLIEDVEIESSLSIVAVIGEKINTTPGVSGKVFHALGRNNINIVAIAQGSSDLNISLLVSKSDEIKALNALHSAFFSKGANCINLFLLGTGLIGGELLEQIKSQKEVLLNEYGRDIKIIAAANTKKMLFDLNGISLEDWRGKISGSGNQTDLDAYINKMREARLPESVFIDCTASEEVTGRYDEILTSGISVVTPNKKANSREFEYFLKLKNASQKNGARFYYETNVGAGLPVISTLTDLVSSGDKVLKIEGVLSGTLSYIFNSFSGEKPFSSIVAEAREKGFTEPDPREDLNGRDVARKLLILSRVAGFKLELNDINIENLVPEELRSGCTKEEFMKRLNQWDEEFGKRQADALLNGKVLRYIAKYEHGAAEVRLQEVDSSHPFYSLSGSDNIISFTTLRYNLHPMVIKGPGAGAAVTAAGVFADIIKVSNHFN